MGAPPAAVTSDAKRARSRRLALVLGCVATGFYAAFIVASYLRSHR